MDSNNRIRKIFRQLAKRDGITPRMISEKSGLNYRTIIGFLSGKRGFSLATADMFLDTLGLEFGIRRKQEGSNRNGDKTDSV